MSDNLTVLTSEKAWYAVFLEALRTHGVISKAAEFAGISRWTAYHYRSIDPLFAEEWSKALELGVDALEDAAKMRAFQGSDLLLIFLLKANRPEKYRETSRVLNVNITPDEIVNLSDDELNRLADQLDKVAR